MEVSTQKFNAICEKWNLPKFITMAYSEGKTIAAVELGYGGCWILFTDNTCSHIDAEMGYDYCAELFFTSSVDQGGYMYKFGRGDDRPFTRIEDYAECAYKDFALASDKRHQSQADARDMKEYARLKAKFNKEEL